MKNLFSINKSHSDGAAPFDDNPYLTGRVSPELRERMDRAFDILREDPEPPPPTAEQAALKKKSRIMWIIGVASLVGAIALFLVSDDGMSTPMTILQFTLLIVSIVATFLARRADGKLNEHRRESLNVDFDAASKQMNAVAEEAARELGVPRGAATLEILPYHYKMAGDKEIRVGKKNHFDNISTSAWIEKDALCLATAQELFRIPLTAIRATRAIDEDYEIDFWLKSEECDSETYQEFNIRSAGILGKKCHGYYAVELKGELEFFVPGYDWAVFCELTAPNA